MTKEIELASLTRKRENHRLKVTSVLKRLDELTQRIANRSVVEKEMLRLEVHLAKCQEVQEDLELLPKVGEKLQQEIES
ncbi:hypothetical protein M513_08833 [Trichuris suis]|uniref:Uncharacterized protein n=1 Tax=Trichuris suis TaxID=68888 RepID=A0A085LZD7_9BILA|nr:hypothetical protein M513_08833 [Trichuris suis]